MKRVLFIGMNFYKYENQIIRRLQKQGYRVDYFIDKKDFFIDHIHFIHLSSKKKETMIERYQIKYLKKISENRYDYVFVIVGRYLKKFFLEELRAKNHDAVFILYLWDDIKRIENYEFSKNYFDRIYSFDPNDAKRENIHFLPLFYCGLVNADPWAEQRKKKLDVFSVMYLHTDREKIAKKLVRKYPDARIKIIFKCSLLKAIKSRINRTEESKKIVYRKKTVSEKKLISGMMSSCALLDIQFPSQVGLTMRTFDTMSAGRKLITTNASIQYYDFFHENNILIISREQPEIPSEFLVKVYQPISDSILKKYSLEEWLNVMFEGNSVRYLIKNNPYGL